MFHRLVGVGRRFLKYLTSALAKRRVRRHRRLLLLEPLAARQVLAAYTATGDSATLTINNTGEQLSIAADASDYVVTTSGGTNWTGAAATGATPSGATLRLAKSTFTGTIDIVDQSGINSARVTFTSNSGTTYGANFTVTLNDSPGVVTFDGSNPSFGAKNLTVSTTGGSGNIVFSNGGTVAATSGSISLTSGGSITVGNNSALSTTTGNLSLTANGAVSLGTSAAVSTTSGTLTFAANGSVSLGTSAAVSTTSGTLGVTATTGAISFGSSSSIASTSGANVTLSSGTSVSATVDSVADVSGGVVSITAVSGIAVNTAATSASLTVSSAGSINVSDTAGGLTVTSATTQTGSITLRAANGNLTLTTVSANGGAINATTTGSGSILVDSVIATNGTVTLTSMGTIEEVGSGDASVDVTGTELNFTAVTGIGVNSGSTLEVNAVNGSAAGQLTASVSGAGALDVQDTAGGLIVVSATTSNGAVTLAAVDGDLTVSSATAGGSSTNMTLTTTTSGNITLTNLTNTGDRVTVNSVGSIIDSGDTLTDITADGVVLIATTGIGVGGLATDTELEISAPNLDVRNATSGGVKVNRTGGSLTITDLDASGGAHSLNGGGYITAANALTIAMSLSTDDSFTFTASNSSTADDDLTINNNAVVTLTNAAARNLTFQAGDDLLLGAGGTITTAGGGSHTVVLDVDREGAAVADGDRGGVTQDSGTTTRVTAGTLTVTAPDGVGSSGQSVYVAAGVLTVNSAGNNGSQFLVEADGLTEFSLAAGTGSVTMTVTTGNLISADSAVDIAATAATVTLSSGSFGDTDVAAGNAIETTVTSLTVNASAANGSIFVRESDGLTALNLNAGTGSIVLHSVTGDVSDTDSADDVAAALFGFSSGSGSLGTSSNLIHSNVLNLEVNATGAVYVSNADALVIGAVNSTLTGVDATGVVDIRSVGALSVNESVTTTTGNVTLQARESAADSTSDLLAISDGVTVSTGAGSITLNGGDGVTAGANSVIIATSTTPATATITVNVDNAAGALGADNDTSDGGIVDFDTNSPDPALTAPGGLTVNGGANEDTFQLKPFASGTITVNGGGPSLPAGSDQLALDLSDVAVGKSTVLLGQAAASGTMTFGAPETEKSVTFSSVEEVSANPTANAYHLVLDMTYSGFANGIADTIELERTDGVSNATTDDLLEIYVNGGSAPFFSGEQSGILALTVIGSTDDDQLQITETSLGMPQLAAVTPAIGAVAVDNTALTPAGGVTAGSHLIASGRAYLAGITNTTAGDWDRTDVAIHFDGGASPDIDTIKVVLARPHSVSTVGTATQGNLATDLWPLELGGEGAGGLDLLISYANVSSTASVEWVGAGGAVLADATATSATTEMTIRDFNPAVNNGVNIVEGNNGFTEQKFSGFSWLYALGGDGGETIRLESLDTNDPDGSGNGLPISLLTLDGDNVPTVYKLLTATATFSDTGRLGTDAGNDTLIVEALPAGVTVVLLGGAGDDQFLVYNSQDTESQEDDSVAGFAGTLIVSPAAMAMTESLLDLIGPDELGGNDSLIIRDLGDAGGGDTVFIGSTTQTGTFYIDGTPETGDVVSTAVNGLFDGVSIATPQIIYSLIESVTIELGVGADEVSLDFQGKSDELATLQVFGNNGDDVFEFLSDTPYGADRETPQQGADIPVLTFYGELGNDSFVFMDSAELFGIGTCVDGGEGVDKLDFSNFLNERAVYLVTIGAIDGYQGYEGDWGIARGGGQLGGGDFSQTRLQGDYPCFTNIDELEGSPQPYDVLYGADRNTYWNLDGYNDVTLDAGIVMDGIPLSIDAQCQCGGYVGQDLAFTDMENLFGGGLRDWFDIGPSFQLTGAIGGGEHGPVSDTLDMRDRTDDLEVDLTLLTASFAGGIDVVPDIVSPTRNGGKYRPQLEEGGDIGASIENLLGGTGNDTLIGDVDVNWIAGYEGDDTLNGMAGADSVDGGWGNDVLQVAGTEAASDISIGGPGESLDPLDDDLMVNIGSEAVTLGTFNTSPIDFSNSIDEYDGNGVGLVLNASGALMHLGATVLTNAPTVAGGAGNDAVTVSYENSVATTYSGGAGTMDSIMLTLEATDIQAMPIEDILAIQAFINDPLAATLTLTGTDDKGNFTVSNDFESVRIAVYDSGQVVEITSCFAQITGMSQIQFGTESDDSLSGTERGDLIFGMGGADVLNGLNGGDCLFGGAGDDTVDGGDNTDTIAGGEGDDSLDGGLSGDRVLGGLGDDSVLGGAGSDWLEGNAGIDVLLGGSDLDMMYGGSGNDSLDGAAGNDLLWGQAGDDTLIGGDGDDTLNGGVDTGTLLLHDIVDGGTGNDHILTQGCESEYDSIQGGLGTNSLSNIDTDGVPSDMMFNRFEGLTNGITYIYGHGARITGNDDANYLDFRIKENLTAFVRMVGVPSIDGCAGDDTIYGTDLRDTIYGNADNDTIYGYGLADLLDGGSGNDSIYGGNDPDTIYGQDGDDRLYGEIGNDSLYGGRGTDSLWGSDGDDILDGGQGADTLDGAGGGDLFLTQSNESEFDSLIGGGGSDRLTNTGVSSLVLNGFDGPGNGMEEVVANFASILGNSNGNNFDFRLSTGIGFVRVLNALNISGEGGDDTIRGSAIPDTLFGGDGNDTLYGNGGADSLSGGGGDDSLIGGSDGDTLSGGAGNDTIEGGIGNDIINGGEGLDSLGGGDGNDVLDGGLGFDTVWGDGGDDEIRVQRSEASTDVIRGGSGRDRIVNIAPGAPLVFTGFAGPLMGVESLWAGTSPLYGDSGVNVFDFRLSTTSTGGFVDLRNVTLIDVGNGNDSVLGTNANDTIYGGGGNDSISAAGGSDTVYGGPGNDQIYGGAGNDRLFGDDGDDSIYGEAGDDLLSGLAGADKLYGLEGNDILDGGEGLVSSIGDTVDGGVGNDVIRVRRSEAEFDVIRGGTGTDTIVNMIAGTDVVMNSMIALTLQIEGFSGNNAWLMGNGNINTFDLRLNATGSASITVANLAGINGGDGNDIIHGTKGADTIVGGAGNDFIYGYDGADSLAGGDGDDSIDGGTGNDILKGEAGGDTLLGGAGNDWLIGGLGVDRMTSGAGNDIFRFTSEVGDSTQIDVMLDLSTTDMVRFRGYTFDTGVASYTKLNLSAANTANAVLHLTNTGLTVNATTIKQISTPNLKVKPLATKVLFVPASDVE